MQDPERYRQAVLGLYTNILRYSRSLDSSFSKKISQQFRRHQKRGNIGHLHAGYRLEEQLRAVLQGKLQLDELKQQWKSSKQKPSEEANAVGRRRLWSLQPERAWDEFNYVQISPNHSRISTREANLRARYLKGHNITKENADFTVIDTVFAPLWQASKLSNTARIRAQTSAPRKVSVHTVVRSGGELSVLRVQGQKPRAKGFVRHISKVFRENTDDEKYKNLEVHRRILINRAANIRRNMNYLHLHKLRKMSDTHPRPTVRLPLGLTCPQKTI